MTAHILHSNHSAAWNRHHDSIMASLSRRLEVARVAKDSRLVELLEQERQQISIAPPQSQPRRSNWVQTLKQKLAELAFGGSELRVCQFTNGSDLWWYAINPQTGHYVYADSEAELRLWIQQNYQGS